MKTLNEILQIIDDNQRAFSTEKTEFSYQTLKQKRHELISLGKKIGCFKEDFQEIFSSLETVTKYSHYNNLLDWGVNTPSPLDYYRMGKRKRIKKLYNHPLENDDVYYIYKYKNGQLVELSHYLNDKNIKDKNQGLKYFCYLDKSIYSFQFDNQNKYLVTIHEAKFNDKNQIISFAEIVTAGLPDNESDENVVKWCQSAEKRSLMDYQHFNYDNDKLVSADYYLRIYDFLPQISGYKFGSRYIFVYDENNTIKTAEFINGFNPCVFEA